MTRRGFGATLLACACAPAYAASKESLGRELIDKCIQALGGPAFRNMQDRLEVGRAFSFYRERLSGLSIAHLYTRYPEPPSPEPVGYSGILERESFGKKQEDNVLFLESGAYEVTFRGVRPLPDETVQKHRESTVTNILFILRQRMNEPGLSFEAGSTEVIDNRQVQTVDVYDNDDRKVTVYLGAHDNLPVMQRYMKLDPTYKERIEEVTRFSKYHDAGQGVMWPLDIGRERDGEKIYQMFSERVSVGNNFEGSLFDLPSGMKMLKKENF